MNTQRVASIALMAIVTGIGCGGGRAQDAAARTEDAEQQAANVQLAETPETPVKAIRPAAASAATGGASLQGIVHWSGTAPTREKISMDADPVCQQQHAQAAYKEDVIVNNATLGNVLVYLKEGVSGSYSAPSTPVVLNQAGCMYKPHVAGIRVNQPLQIVNSDSTLHNINAKPTANRPFNVAQPVQGMKTDKTFTKPEVMVKFKCNVHPWMNAYLGVLEHPFFAVTGEDGSFTIAGVPDGTYVLEAWHEVYGAKTQNVTVSGGRVSPVEFTFSAQ